MKCAIYLYCITPHWVPLCDEMLQRMGEAECKVIYLNEISVARSRIGWNEKTSSRFHKVSSNAEQCKRWLYESDNLLCEVRDAKLFEARSRQGLKTFYTSERWFKPRFGMWRLLHPTFVRTALKIGNLLNRDPNFTYLPVGIYAAEDMYRLMMIARGKISYFFRGLSLAFEAKPGGVVDRSDKINMWAYFVKSRTNNMMLCDGNETRRRILWVGRLLKLKHVDDIIHAVQILNRKFGMNFILDIVGSGPDEKRLKAVASSIKGISFKPPVTNDEVRRLMSDYQIYILSSDAREGWGAVVGEALEEGMLVLGTKEAGASATQLPKPCLYKAGDVNALCGLLLNSDSMPIPGIGHWTPAEASTWLLGKMA